MGTQGLVEIALAAQVTLVGLFLLRAVARSLRLRRNALARTTAHPATSAAHERTEPDGEAVQRAAVELAALRRTQAEAEASFSARRRTALLELREHQRRTADLAAQERDLEEHVSELRTEVRHFEQRHVALTAEIRAALESSALLRDRSATARRELEATQADRVRIHARVVEDTERLRDLMRRRSLLRAETEELSALLELLQQLAGAPVTLTGLSDGELRDRAAAALEHLEHLEHAEHVAATHRDTDAQVPAKGPNGRITA